MVKVKDAESARERLQQAQEKRLSVMLNAIEKACDDGHTCIKTSNLDKLLIDQLKNLGFDLHKEVPNGFLLDQDKWSIEW